MIFFKKKLIPLTEFFPSGFVDIHSHLLPAIDDGAKDIANSIDLIEQMASLGIEHFVTTPHIMSNLYPNTPEIINEKLALLKNSLKNKGLTKIQMAAAAEYMIDEAFASLLEKGTLLTLKDSFILIEMSYFSPPINFYEILFEIQLKGYKPILAHPERYFSYHNDLNSYYKLKKAGCLFQLNLLSLTVNYGKMVQNVAYKLLDKGLYDFVGTDTHHQQHIDLLESIGTKSNYNLLKDVMDKNKLFFGF